MSFNEYDNPFAVRWRLARHAVPRRSICLIVIIFDIVYCLRASAPPLWRWQMELQEEEAEEAAEEARVEAIEKMGAGAPCRVPAKAPPGPPMPHAVVERGQRAHPGWRALTRGVRGPRARALTRTKPTLFRLADD